MSILPARPAPVTERNRLPKAGTVCCVSAVQIRRYGPPPATAASRFMNGTTRARFRFLVVVSRRRRMAPVHGAMRRRCFAERVWTVFLVVLIPRVFAACDDLARKCWSHPLPLFFRVLLFLRETQGRNIDGPPWTKTANEPSVRKEPIYLFPPCLRASVVQRFCFDFLRILLFPLHHIYF